jgi:hypothetical protein
VTPPPVPPLVQGVPDAVLVAMIAVIGVLVGAVVALVGHLVLARSASKSRIWTNVWPEKAKAYKELLEWTRGASALSDEEVWALAQAYASQDVRSLIDAYLVDPSKDKVDKLGQDIAAAVRRDLRTNIKL